MDIDRFINDSKVRIKRLSGPFEGCEKLEVIINKISSENLTASSATRTAVAQLFAKACKSFFAVRVLAATGFGEDALIVSRSLLNLSFVMGYICAKKENSEYRANIWMARGHSEQKKFFEQYLKQQLPEEIEKRVDWDRVEQLTSKGSWPKIEEIAKEAGMEETYRLAYRFLSSTEHSDAWSIVTFLKTEDEKGSQYDVRPSDERVPFSLRVTVQAMLDIIEKFCETFQISYPKFEVEEVKAHFGVHGQI